MDNERLADSDAVGSIPDCEKDAKRGGRARLSRAEAHALRRSAPLTPAQFKELSRLAEQGINPLRHI